MDLDLIRRLSIPAETKVVLCVLDGLGGLPGPRGRTALEAADCLYLDRLAEEGMLGQTLPVGHGITPGSGPGHLGLFGYDPLAFEVGRGVLEATGIDFPLGAGDLAARGNLCTTDAEGNITDRRASRVATEITAEIAEQLSGIELPGFEVLVRAVREHRFVLVLRPREGSEPLSEALSETDPQQEGVPALPAEALAPEAAPAADLVNRFVAEARARIGDREQANQVLLRGWSRLPSLPQLPELWKLRAAAIATYPMYRGLARLVGMDIVDGGDSLATQLAAVHERWDDYDFFFVHYKPTDAAGEDGDFARKQRAVADFDDCVPELLALEPNVVVVTGDHSTPATMAAHSWHPVPALIWGDHVRPDDSHRFGERACARGGLGTILAKELLPIAFAHASRLTKYGA
jgi:2,3-bisphosphoglycerate-independent phosphoglycerate mutase